MQTQPTTEPQRIFRAASPVPGILPVRGYALCGMDDDAGLPLYFARMEGDGAPFAVDFPLRVSRFDFNPTQERFAWLVSNGFPGMTKRAGGTLTPICDDDIDAAIAAERLAA